jgi:predicted acylesterase/phospholipase RssA
MAGGSFGGTMNTRRSLIACATFFLCGNAIGASTTNWAPILRVNSDKDAYMLKVGHATFESFTNAISSSAFNNTSELLKIICEQSRPRRAAKLGATNWNRVIDIDIALGSDYQIFRWLDSGSIDAAFICPTALQFSRLGRTNVPSLIRLDALLGTNAAVAFQPRLRSFALGNPQPRPNPEGDFQTFLKSLTNAPSAPAFRLLAPSHLSGAGFITPVAYAHRWFRAMFPAITTSPSATESNFWHQFFAHLELSLGSAPRAATANIASETIVIEFSSDSLRHRDATETGWKIYTNANYIGYPWLTNVFVARAQVAEKIVASSIPGNWAVPGTPDATLAAVARSESLTGHLEQKFSIPELVSLLRADQEASAKEELALVLSGGGVKAAYQSALIDHLYSAPLLSNTTNAPPQALQVKSIAGNSGGALLGFFVAGLEENDSRRLTNILWGAPNNLVTDRHIFGFWDMLRWASFVIGIWFFIATLRLSLWLPRAWRRVRSFLLNVHSHTMESLVSLPGINQLLQPTQLVASPIGVREQPGAQPVSHFSDSPAPVGLAPRTQHHPPQPSSPTEPAHALALHYCATILGVLVATPVLLQIVNGEHGREHIPAIEGAFYFLCLCLVMFLDNCLAPTQQAVNSHMGVEKLFVPAYFTRTWPPSPRSIAAIIGFLVAVTPVAAEFCWQPRWVTTLILRNHITIGGLVLCCGMILFWAGIIWRLCGQGHRCIFKASGDYICALLLGISVIGLTYAVLIVLGANDVVTFLELTKPFWKSLVAVTIAFSLVYLVLGRINQCPSWLQKVPPVPWLFHRFKAAMKFQLAKHQSGTLGLSRLARMHLIFTVGFLWWNVVVAPAFYGNSRALNYLETAYANFVADKPYQLQTRYAAPANDLVANRERYFLFHHPSDERSSSLSGLRSDERGHWTVHPYENAEHMRDVVFASGSPFPIFSPHAVRSTTETNWLVDGGFAHNVPLEAAKEIGSRQVLLLDSSPRERPADPTPQTQRAGVFGQLLVNIPRLFPFLFQRSQVADFLVREQMFIVSLSPAPDKAWPPLFDFRTDTVKFLLEVAGQDTTRRIGRIETAGPPVFLISVRMGRGEPPSSLGSE